LSYKASPDRIYPVTSFFPLVGGINFSFLEPRFVVDGKNLFALLAFPPPLLALPFSVVGTLL